MPSICHLNSRQVTTTVCPGCAAVRTCLPLPFTCRPAQQEVQGKTREPIEEQPESQCCLSASSCNIMEPITEACAPKLHHSDLRRQCSKHWWFAKLRWQSGTKNIALKAGKVGGSEIQSPLWQHHHPRPHAKAAVLRAARHDHEKASRARYSHLIKVLMLLCCMAAGTLHSYFWMLILLMLARSSP